MTRTGILAAIFAFGVLLVALSYGVKNYPIQHCGWYGEQCDDTYSRPRRF